MDPSPAPDIRPAVALAATRHTVAWMTIANGVGLWMGICLLWPGLGDLAGPLSYGRWAPVHLNLQLYGSCSLPLVGLLLVWLLEPHHPSAASHARTALWAWSAALAAGGVSWLAGFSSGKLFMDWHGWGRPAMPAAMIVLWTVLSAHTLWRWPVLPPAERALRGGLLAGLSLLPPVFYWAAGREVFPSVNPHSGGATGASLLASTLGIVAIYGLLPRMAGVPKRPGRQAASGAFVGLLTASVALCAAVDHGDASHRDPAQIGALAVLFLWIPMAALRIRSFAWNPAARPWLRGAFAWWVLLVGSGFATFLPGISERLKFTHALVAHAHLALAGLVVSVNAAVLAQLLPGRAFRSGAGLWSAGCAAHVLAVGVLGILEHGREADLFLGAPWVTALMAARLAAGVLMTLASVRWMCEIRGS